MNTITQYVLYIEDADGDNREGPYAVDLAEIDNDSDVTLEQLNALAIGESIRYGGGAQPIWEIVRQ